MATAPIITMQNVSFAYGAVPVLEDVTLTVEADQFVYVVGPNGGGKTTLLKLMLGLLRPDSGTVQVFGESPIQGRRRIGYMPQHALHDPQFPITVLEVVLLGRLENHWGGPYSAADRQIARTALSEVGMENAIGRLYNSLSGGQRQRVLIARALACKPDMLLLDEPTANVDVAAEARLQEILQELNKRLTIVMVSHDLGLVGKHVDRVVCVNRRVAVHPTSEISGDVLSELYGADMHLVRHDAHLYAQEGEHG